MTKDGEGPLTTNAPSFHIHLSDVSGMLSARDDGKKLSAFRTQDARERTSAEWLMQDLSVHVGGKEKWVGENPYGAQSWDLRRGRRA